MFLLLFIVLILLALFGMPLFTVLGAIALAAFNGAGIDISSVAVSMYTLAGSPLLVAIPLFTFAHPSRRCPLRAPPVSSSARDACVSSCAGTSRG